MKAAFLVAALLGLATAAQAVTTVCTITVNSPDEREVLKQSLPPDKYRFVELVEHGRPDWLASACQEHVQCDVLVVSGHFAGTEFYSSRFDAKETLPVDEMERVSCSASCPDLFSHLKEVYLFGCDTLNPAPAHVASPEIARSLVRSGQSPEQAEKLARWLGERYGESSRDHMRRLFPDVPVIYGFSSLAPLGRVAGPMLRRHLESGPDAPVGSGRPSARLLRIFGPSSMVATEGLKAGEPNADVRGEMCRFYDDRQGAADKVATIHEMMDRAIAEARLSLERIEKFFATVTPAERESAAYNTELLRLAGDARARKAYLDFVHDADDPAVRVRMIALARTVGWLSATEQRAEQGRVIHDVLARSGMGFGEVELVCTLNPDGTLNDAVDMTDVKSPRTAQSAALACLGNREARDRVIAALASVDEGDVQVAQSYLRHHPITEGSELRVAAVRIVRMKGGPAQVRALETLARLHVTDHEVLGQLSQLFASTSSPAVQRAIAEIFLRAGPADIATPELLSILRQRRLPVANGPDLVEVLLTRLHGS
ncbi:MAG: hypothetical protein ACM3SO_03365 [Betaproteobacteria bacterium]